MSQIPSDLLLFIPWPTLEFQCERKDAGNGDLMHYGPYGNQSKTGVGCCFHYFEDEDTKLKS